MVKRRAQFVAIIGMIQLTTKIYKLTAYCQSCADFNFTYELCPRVYPESEPVPYDLENW
jgi:hypothetical protein